MTSHQQLLLSPFRLFRAFGRIQFMGLIVLGFAPLTVGAQIDPNISKIELRLKSAVRFIDNFYYQRDRKQANSGLLVEPSIKMTRVGKLFKTDLALSASAAAFGTGRQDNYADGLASIMIGMQMPGEQLLQLRGGFTLGHDPFGTQRTEGRASANADLDRWRTGTVKLSYSVGEQLTSRFGLKLSYQTSQRDYTTNRSATRALDRRSSRPEASILYFLSPKFSALIGATQSDTEFDTIVPGGINRSGQSQSIFAGAIWKATAKTSGEVRLGAGRWNPDDPNFRSTDNSRWSASIDWMMSQRTTFDLTTARRFLPSYREDTRFIDDQTIAFGWRQLWTRNVNTNTTLTFGNRDLVGSGNEHDVASLTSRINWSLDRGLRVYLTAVVTERDAVVANEDFERTSVTVGFNANLN